MRAVFDSNILIDFLNGNSDAEKTLKQYDGMISVITWIEVSVGAASRESDDNIEDFLNLFEVIPLSKEVAARTVRVRQQKKLRLPDAVIYASAEILGINLITRNTKDFSNQDPIVKIPYKI